MGKGWRARQQRRRWCDGRRGWMRRTRCGSCCRSRSREPGHVVAGGDDGRRGTVLVPDRSAGAFSRINRPGHRGPAPPRLTRRTGLVRRPDAGPHPGARHHPRRAHRPVGVPASTGKKTFCQSISVGHRPHRSRNSRPSQSNSSWETFVIRATMDTQKLRRLRPVVAHHRTLPCVAATTCSSSQTRAGSRRGGMRRQMGGDLAPRPMGSLEKQWAAGPVPDSRDYPPCGELDRDALHHPRRPDRPHARNVACLPPP